MPRKAAPCGICGGPRPGGIMASVRGIPTPMCRDCKEGRLLGELRREATASSRFWHARVLRAARVVAKHTRTDGKGNVLVPMLDMVDLQGNLLNYDGALLKERMDRVLKRV